MTFQGLLSDDLTAAGSAAGVAYHAEISSGTGADKTAHVGVTENLKG